MGRQKSSISMLSLQRILEIKIYRTVWTMGHTVRRAIAKQDANYKLASLIDVETPADKPSFAAIQLAPSVSSKEIKTLV